MTLFRRPPVLLVLVLAACAPTISSSTTTTEASVSTTPSSTTETSGTTGQAFGPITRIAIDGQAPAALALSDDGLWVYSIESGDLTLVDLETETVTRSIHIGGLGSHLVAANGPLFAARFDTGGSGEYLVIVDPASGEVGGVSTGPLGGLTLDPEGSILALAKADLLMRVDPGTLEVVEQSAIDVDDEHMEVVATSEVAWLSSDHTPLQRRALPDLADLGSLDVGGGVPFVAQAGLVWGARPGTLWAVDPTTESVVREVALPDITEVLALDIDSDAHEAWLAVRKTGGVGSVVRIDLVDETILGEYPVSLPAGVKIASDRVWVASYLDNELLAFPYAS